MGMITIVDLLGRFIYFLDLGARAKAAMIAKRQVITGPVSEKARAWILLAKRRGT